MTTIAPTARAREQPGGDEEAGAELKLGEFQSVPSLSLSEARLLISVVMDKRKEKEERGEAPPLKDTDTFVKARDYLEVFARFKSKENIEAVERLLLAQDNLEPFERSQLGSLCCESADEAKTLIPSLMTKVSDTDLQELLDEIARLRNLVE